MLARPVSQPSKRGRLTSFTPDRIDEIKSLIESGRSCEEIAALMGVAVSTLQKTCYRLGISLRQPPRVLNRRPPPTAHSVGVFSVMVRWKGKERASALPLTSALLERMALEAALRNLTISEFAGHLVAEVLKKELVEKCLHPRGGYPLQSPTPPSGHMTSMGYKSPNAISEHEPEPEAQERDC
jgi:hypothetical protein